MTFVRKYTTRIKDISKRTKAMGAVKVGETISMHGIKSPVWEVQREDLGWFILMEGSHEMIYVGKDKPNDLKIGQEIEVTIKGL
jgi:hypothetical protein